MISKRDRKAVEADAYATVERAVDEFGDDAKHALSYQERLQTESLLACASMIAAGVADVRAMKMVAFALRGAANTADMSIDIIRKMGKQ